LSYKRLGSDQCYTNREQKAKGGNLITIP